MCGIAGVIHWGESPRGASEIERMTRALAHRGPDGEGFFRRENVALGHRRLSIIDPAAGRQPMCNEDESVWVTYNGEVYNFEALRAELARAGHVFRTRCDTEVIVHAYEQWGAGCVKKFRGMFAFGVVDFRARKLLLARDHLGIKPLVYRVTADGVAFASELQALRQMDDPPRRGRLDAVEMFLRFQYVPAPMTIYKDVFKLPPAHTLEVPLDRPGRGYVPEPLRYWDVGFSAGRGLSEEGWVEAVAEAVRGAVKSQLVSDVPFGVFLSGGIDSTLVALNMRRCLDRPVKAFTIAFDDEKYSELAYARQAAERIGVELIHRTVTADAVHVLPKLLEHYGEPFADSSAVPTWHVSQLAREHVPMVQSGDGGDEAFGGYHSYGSWMNRRPAAEVMRFLRRPSAGGARAVVYAMTGLYRAKLPRWAEMMTVIPEGVRRRLWRAEFHELMNEACPLFEEAGRRAEGFDRVGFSQYMDLQTYLPGDILTKVDIASMCHGLEARPPLLDVDVVELAARLPAGLRMRVGLDGEYEGKLALKRVLGRDFPPGFIHRRKQGFGAPCANWFLEGQAARVELEGLVRDPRGPLGAWFDTRAIEGILAGHTLENDRSTCLWHFLVLGQWLRMNGDVTFG